MAKNAAQARKTMLLGAPISIPLCTIDGGFGMAAFSLNPSIEPAQSIPYLFQIVLPAILKPFALSDLVAVMMSSKDAFDILLTTYKFWGPVLVIPIAAIFLDKCLPRWAFCTSCLTGGIIVIMWDILNLEKTTNTRGLIPGILGNFIVYTILYQFNKFFSLKETSPLLSKTSVKR